MKKAIYAGSFDIFTKGHESIVERALKIFDEIIILVAISPTKAGFLTTKERVECLNIVYASSDKVSADSYEGLTADYCNSKGINFLIRGLRPTGDFDNEYLMARINKSLHSHIETIFLTAENANDFVSSSMVREVLGHGGDVSRFVSKPILDFLDDKLKKDK